MNKIGLIAYSWALSDHEPNICNIKLAQEVHRIIKKMEQTGIEVVVVSQWEIAKALSITTVKNLRIVNSHRKKGAYLDSEEVTDQAAAIFQNLGITTVIPVAQPFLHIIKCRKLLKRAGFSVVKEKIRWIGFYKRSLQPWTKGPLSIIAYAIMQKLFGIKGHHIKTRQDN